MLKVLTVSASLALATITPSLAQEEPQGGSSPAEQVVKALIVESVLRNIDATDRESGILNKAIRVLGPSVKDIKEHGILGGKNSFFRKPFG